MYNDIFQVDSNFGADGTGTVVVNRGRVVFSGGRIDFRAFQIYGATDPSICEVYFVMSRVSMLIGKC